CDMVGERGRWAFAHTCFRGSTPRGNVLNPGRVTLWERRNLRMAGTNGRRILHLLVGATAHLAASQNKAVRIEAELAILERLYGQQNAV
ncbi:hypothetical protein HaLaN_30631, partial [Haematococcus lacustris]